MLKVNSGILVSYLRKSQKVENKFVHPQVPDVLILLIRMLRSLTASSCVTGSDLGDHHMHQGWYRVFLILVTRLLNLAMDIHIHCLLFVFNKFISVQRIIFLVCFSLMHDENNLSHFSPPTVPVLPRVSQFSPLQGVF